MSDLEPRGPRTRLIEVTTELMDTFGGRTLDGRRLSYEWGEPTGHEPDSDRYVYTPTITATDDGWLREQREQAATEARRELLAKVEGLPCAATVQRPLSIDGLVSRAAVLRLIEESDRG